MDYNSILKNLDSIFDRHGVSKVPVKPRYTLKELAQIMDSCHMEPKAQCANCPACNGSEKNCTAAHEQVSRLLTAISIMLSMMAEQIQSELKDVDAALLKSIVDLLVAAIYNA